MDVARCVYEANLIKGDLIPILAKWPEDSMDNKFKSRIVLSCFEVMVPLTWPIDQDKEKMTVNHHRHIPVLELAQLQYKSAIINFDGARLLHSAVRSALPAMAIPIGDRTPRDQGIIKLVLFFLRNIAMIAPSPGVKFDGDDTEISRSTTIDAFSYQDIFIVLLTIASNMGEDFRTEDTTLMEILYHLVKQVDVEKLFMDEAQLNKAKAGELSDLMKKEKAMLQTVNRKGPTRHNRFGTMVWVKREDGKMTSLSGQDALADAAARNKKMDESKTFRPTRRHKKPDQDEKEFGLPTPLTPSAAKQLRAFVEEFLDSGFNPLFLHIRKSIDREAPHIMVFHRRQFFYLVSWFLQAERVRRKRNKAKNKSTAEDVSSFNLIASVLNQEMFITLSKGLHDGYDYKDWHSLAAAMRCFTQILLTVQEMAEEGTEDDQEIAENVLSRLFYEESTHDVIANIARTYKDQGFEYLDAATELVHHFLRVLEAYSKQNADMQIRSRKRARRKKKADKQQNGSDDVEDDENDDSGGDEAAVERVSKERKFDFHRFTSRFTPQGVVDTFIAFTKYYHDLNDAQLKRAHRYFYRLSFKQEMSVMLFRVDMLYLLVNMVKGSKALDKSSKMFKDWEELIKQIFRKCFKKIEDRPELLVEMLFSKLPPTAFFLEYGYEKQTSAAKAQPRPAAELVFKHTTELDQQIAIAVGSLLDKNEADHIEWIKKILTTAEIERRSWSNANDELAEKEAQFDDAEMAELPQEPKLPPIFTVRPDTTERRMAMFKNPYLRLLLGLAGAKLLGQASEQSPESVWVIPAEVTANQIKDALHYINQAEFSPPTFEDGTSAEQQLKRKTAPRKKAAFDDDNEEEDGLGDFLDDGVLFPAGGPTARKVIDEPKKAKKLRRKQRSASQEIDDEEREERARKRRDKEREKALKIKSALYVKDGEDDFDSDEDEEFFARERAIKARAEQAAKSARGGFADDDAAAVRRPAAKRKSEALLDNSTDDDEDEVDDLNFAQRVLSSQSAADASETDDTVVDGSEAERPKRRRLSADDDNDEDIGMEDTNGDDSAAKSSAPATNSDAEADEAPVPTSTARKARVRGGFVIDSDDDE